MEETEGVFFMRVGDKGVEERERRSGDNSVRERRDVLRVLKSRDLK